MDNIFLPLIITLIIITILSIWIYIYCKDYFWLVISGFLIRLFLIFIHEQTRLFGDFDISDYLHYLTEFKQFGSNDILSYIKPHSAFYTILYPGWIYNNLEESGLWVIRVVNAAIGVTIIAPISWIKQIVFSRKLSYTQVFIITFWPTWMRYNVEIGRASISVLSIIVGLFALLTLINQYKSNNNKIWNIYTVIILAFASFLRLHYIVYFLPIISLSFMNEVKKIKTSPYLLPIIYLISSLLTLIIVAIILVIYQSITQQTYGLSSDNSLEAIISLSEEGEQGNSGYLQGIYPRTPLDFIWFLPLSGFYFMFSPMPWDIHSVFAAGSSLQALIIFVWCFKAVIHKKKYISKNKMLNLLLVPIIFSSIAFGLGVKNAASAERWRLPSTLLLILTTTSVLEYVKQERNIVSNWSDTKY
ncbi:MAG: hypothetical protein KME60_30855 [Cyanomargarita calcarea GSE-NOS-MK-12-04C]|jgi:hypothetical protein|uniref:Uncharacterized protein n=1 Tax=Cyanomargarita calcarea GSE-NOS-MK-12-04C TaxID=2839659 RepID=A0A951QSK4_9CYAN|nr:hypothetical protein [Cyanomargarita calcarea GSE-NOS-MK-12-04C]